MKDALVTLAITSLEVARVKDGLDDVRRTCSADLVVEERHRLEDAIGELHAILTWTTAELELDRDRISVRVLVQGRALRGEPPIVDTISSRG